MHCATCRGSINHVKQEVVIWQATPLCGIGRSSGAAAAPDTRFTFDNIYTRHPGKPGTIESAGPLKGDPVVGPPMYRQDAVLLPVAAQKPAAAGAGPSPDPVHAARPAKPAAAQENPLHRVARPRSGSKK